MLVHGIQLESSTSDLEASAASTCTPGEAEMSAEEKCLVRLEEHTRKMAVAVGKAKYYTSKIAVDDLERSLEELQRSEDDYSHVSVSQTNISCDSY